MEIDGNTYTYQDDDGKIYVPFPLPTILKCAWCKAGKYASKTKVANAISHIKACRQVKVTASFTCVTCKNISKCQVEASRHWKTCGGATSSSHPEMVDETLIVGEKLVFLYPGGPSRCPLCSWLSRAEGGKAAISIKHHLARAHNKEMKNDWKCRICGVILGGYEMRTHHLSHPGQVATPSHASPSPSLQQQPHQQDLPQSPHTPLQESVPAISSMPSSVLTSVTSIFQRSPFPRGLMKYLRSSIEHRHSLISTPLHCSEPPIPPLEDEQGSLGTGSIHNSAQFLSYPGPGSTQPSPSLPSPSSSPSSSPSTSPFSTPSSSSCSSTDLMTEADSESGDEDNSQGDSFNTLPSQPAELATPLESPDGEESDESQHPDETGPITNFHRRWVPAFESASSVEELNSTLLSCSLDWLAQCKDQDEPVVSSRRLPQDSRGQGGRTRNQSRQQQRLRRKRPNFAKSHLQRLYSLYPRRATRKVLGEKSSPYSGDRNHAEEFLVATYHRQAWSPSQLADAQDLYDSCEWAIPSKDVESYLAYPPFPAEISVKLGKAANTAPGKDGLEYRHLRKLDPHGDLLAVVFRHVWRLGIPACWKSSRTVPIHKKGDTSDLSNFRPISLLPTMYKIFAGVISSRLMKVATNEGWISPEQKGFLPGVCGIQEHTHLLHAAIEEAKHSKRNLVIAWLDLSNAFGSIPHGVLGKLFESLPIPTQLRDVLRDIYENNVMDFAVGQETIQIFPTTGVRQGDPLSSIIFNLAAEPLIRAVKASNKGFQLFGTRLSTTAYADDIAVVGESYREVQESLKATNDAAKKLGLSFNPAKCVSLLLTRGASDEHQVQPLLLGEGAVRTLEEGEHEVYLGTPIGSRLTFRPPTTLAENLIKVGDSDLAPWQKLEVFRSALLPSLSHHLASGRMEKGALHELDVDCRNFLRKITALPTAANTAFFYADRRVGGLGTLPLTQEADVWTLSRALQLIDSEDQVVAQVAMAQLETTIHRGYGRKQVPNPLPLNEFLAGSMEKGLDAIQHGGNSMNLWTRARRAAMCLKGIKIDVSSEDHSRIIADDVSCISKKAIRGLHTILRQRWTSRLLEASQGKVATGLALEPSKDIAFLTSCRTSLSHQDWHFIHRARLGLLPVRARPGSKSTNKTCRLGCNSIETSQHVISCCKVSLSSRTTRHNSVLDIMVDEARKMGHTVTVNRSTGDGSLRPDLVFSSMVPPMIIDVTIPHDEATNLERAYSEKIQKYQHLGRVFPLVVGAMGSWLPTNNEIATSLSINPRKWSGIRRRMRLAAIQGTTTIISKHLTYGGPSQEIEEDDFTSVRVF